MENDLENKPEVTDIKEEVPSEQPQASEQSNQPVKPDYLPDQYWDTEGNQANLRGMVDDLKAFRTALSHKEQEIPTDPSGYGLDNIDLPDDIKSEVRSFAHKLGLSKYQAGQLFGEAAEKLGSMFNQYYDKQDELDREKEEKEYINHEIEEFGGAEKVKEAVKHMDNMFIVAKNKGILNNEEIAHFKHSAIRDAGTLRIFDKLVNLFDTLTNGSTINSQMVGDSDMLNKGKLSRDELVDSVVKKLYKAHSQEDRDKLYKSLENLN